MNKYIGIYIYGILAKFVTIEMTIPEANFNPLLIYLSLHLLAYSS
jgi:hypothetical protein